MDFIFFFFLQFTEVGLDLYLHSKMKMFAEVQQLELKLCIHVLSISVSLIQPKVLVLRFTLIQQFLTDLLSSGPRLKCSQY